MSQVRLVDKGNGIFGIIKNEEGNDAIEAIKEIQELLREKDSSIKFKHDFKEHPKKKNDA